MVRVHFNFRLDIPVVLNRYSIFDKKSGKDYIDFDKTSDCIKKMSSHISEVSSFLSELSKTSRFSLTLPGYALENLSKENKDTIHELKKVLSSKNTELLATTYYNSFCYDYTDAEFIQQIEKEKEYIHTYFHRTPNTFITHFAPKNPTFYNTLKEVGFERIYFSGYNDFEDPKNHNKIFTLKDEGLDIVYRHHDFSVDLNDRFFDEQFRKDLTPEKFIGWLNESEGSIINITIEFDTLFSKDFREFFQSFADIIATSDEIATIIPENFERLSHREIKDSSSLEMSKYNLSEMQTDALGKLYDLEKGVELLSDKDLKFDWRVLQNLYLVRDFSQNSKFRYQENHENHYELYVSYMNIVEDLKRRIKREIKEENVIIQDIVEEKGLNINLS